MGKYQCQVADHLLWTKLPEEIRSLLGTIEHITFSTQGDTSDVAIFTCTHATYVVKHAYKPPFNEWLEREYQVLCALTSTPLPVPRPYTFVKREATSGFEGWLAMSYIPGIPARELLRIEHDAQCRARILRSVGQTLATIHATPVPSELRPDGSSWLEDMLQRADYYLLHYSVEGSPELLQQLKERRPTPVPATLIHGDFALDNTLIVDEQVSGVIDWAGGAAGDPRYDIALACRPTPEVFQIPAEINAFFEGYGGSPLSEEEYDYFVGLYEFF